MPVKKYRCNKIRQSANGEDCTLRLMGVCNGNPNSVCLAHLHQPNFRGRGQKSHDFAGVYACSDCHIEYDQYKIKGRDFEQELLRAWLETLGILMRKNLIPEVALPLPHDNASDNMQSLYLHLEQVIQHDL